MSKFYQVALGALAATPLMAGQASANILCLLIPALCQSGGGTGGSGGTTAVPEIDVTQGLAAVAIVAVLGLIMREKFLRARG